MIEEEDFPTKSMKRAERRHQKLRKIEKARQVVKLWGFDEDWTDDKAHKMADNLKSCSCYMCQNRRRLEGPTRAEIENEIILKETFKNDELNINTQEK